MSMHRVIITSVLALALVSGAALARQSGQGAAMFSPKNGVALQGYDVVSYFQDGRAVRGSKEFSHQWNGVTWHFVNAAHRDAFARHPENFAPQFGGFCAYGVSRGYAVEVDPEAWAVVNGKLYLNYSKRVQRTWDQDRAGYIAKAETNWPRVSADWFAKFTKEE